MTIEIPHLNPKKQVNMKKIAFSHRNDDYLFYRYPTISKSDSTTLLSRSDSNFT